ncbi:ketopantoate reductase family protein [Pseudoalteromonas sp. T1lg65]|uniref:ketopantoate reductase family protein n=1 Tax=Pseudoalteromonas sp. T1lg65 TaxID=2077101 RepID=UPI003F7A78CD
MANIHIVGDGAIGLLLAKHLQSNHQVTLLTRKGQPKSYQYAGLDGNKTITTNITTIDKVLKNSINTCIIPVKSYQIKAAFKAIQPKLAVNATVIFSHNGMIDWSPMLARLLPTQQACFLSTSMAGYKEFDKVIHTGQGASWFGALSAPATPFAAQSFSELFGDLENAQFSTDMQPVLWKKLAINIAINPLTAIEQCQNGQLRQPKYANIVLNLLNEVHHVALLSGVHLALETLITLAYQVMAQTATNYSSMAQDIKYQKRTEIDAMCGFVQSMGEKVGVDTPYNSAMFEKVLQLQRSN